MPTKRKKHSPEFKAKVELEAIKGNSTISEMSSKHKLHSVQISQWKKHILQQLPELFTRPSTQKKKTEDEITAPLYEEIGRLKSS
jgi:transposase-like protein